MSKSSSRSVGGMGLLGLGGMGGTGFIGGTVCSTEDNSFYCRLGRFTAEVRMIIYLILWSFIIFVLPIYYGRMYFKNKSK